MDNSTEENDVPPHVWAILHEFLLGVSDSRLDLRQAHLKISFARIYPFVIFMYVLLVVIGLLTNLYVLVHIISLKFYDDCTYSFLLNNVISDIVKCVIVIPISLYVLLVQNWMLGELLCSFLPMIQDIPMHTTTLTFLLLAWDRFRFIRGPLKPRLPAFVCATGSWLTAICLVLPYPIYIIYIDLGKYSQMSTFQGVGICIVNLADDMKGYLRGMFLTMYAIPLVTISYLFVRVSRELSQQFPAAVVTYEARSKNSSRPRTDSHSTTTDVRSMRGDFDRSSQYSSRNSYRDFESNRIHYNIPEPNLNVTKERRTQKILVAMITTYAICLCPLMILRLARLKLVETYDNAGHFDIVFAVFVWIAFVPTCSTPILYITWQMNRSSMERLRGYFRFSNRKLRQSCETVVTAAGTPSRDRGSKQPPHDSIMQHLGEGFSDTNSSQQDFNTT